MKDEQQPGIVDTPAPNTSGNILTPETAANILDNNQLNDVAKVSEPIIQPGSTEVKTENPTIKKEDKPVNSTQTKTDEPAKTNEETPQPESVYQLEIGENKWNVPQDIYEYVTALHDTNESINNQLVALREFEKDPYQFHAKYNPAIVIDHFKPEVYIQGKLKEKFGEHVFDPTKSYEIGSLDYQYRKAQEQFEREAENYIHTAQTAVADNKKQSNDVYEVAKTEVMQKYNLTPEKYKSLVQDWLDTNKQSDVLELIVKARLAENNATEFKNTVSKEINRVNETPSPTSVIAGNQAPTVDENTKKLAGLMGDVVYQINNNNSN